MQTKEFLDKEASISHSYHSALSSITELPSYIEARDLFVKDQSFLMARQTAGYWGQFPAVLHYILCKSGNLKKNQIEIDLPRAISRFSQLRKDFQKTTLQYEAFAPLMGVKISRKQVSLADGLTLYRLTRSELNRNQPFIEPYFSGWDYHQYLMHPTEIRLPIRVPVDFRKENSHFEASNSAYSVALAQFQDLVDAIQVAEKGNVMLGPIRISGGIEMMPTGQQLPRQMPPSVNISLGKSAIERVLSAYKLITDSNVRDKTLERSLHRFLLGRKRKDLVDKLVDYVIAWEVLALTNNGNALTQELSYRFSLNSATLISNAVSTSKPHDIYSKMKSGYHARSTIVHGGSEAKIKKSLNIGNYENTSELCNFLEDNYRQVLIWLLSIAPRNRPYMRTGGWEELIWP